MRTRIVPYAPFGAAKAPLPDALEAQIVTPMGELSTASVHYHRDGINAADLDGIVEMGFEYLDGDAWVEPPNCRFLSMRGNFDHLEETPTRKYSLVGVGWMMRKAKVWAANGLPVDADGKVQFLSASAGKIMATLIQNAKGRGWGAGISIDFTATADSAGKAWAKVLTIAYDLELDLESILSNLFQQGVCDYRWEGRTLRIFNPGTVMARDLSAGSNPVQLLVADGQTSAPEDWTNEDMLTDAMVLGEEGKRWEFTNGVNSTLGRLENVITQGGVSDPGTASLLAETDLLAGSQTRVSYTREFVLNEEARVRPFRDFQVGDWVSGQRGAGFERLRAASISLTMNADGVKGHAVLGDRLEDLLTKLAKRTKGITGGSSAGGSGVRPAPEGPDTRTPAAPSGLVIGADAYIDDAGVARGRIDADWAHSGNATNGTAMTIDRYQVFYRVNELGATWKQLTSTQDTEVQYSPLPVFKVDGKTPEQFAFKVRAVGNNGRVSGFSGVVAVQMEDDVTPPPIPRFVAADLTTWLRTVTVRWGGKGVSGTSTVDMPRDFDHVNVYQGVSPSGPWTLVGSIGASHELWQSGTMPTTNVWFTLTSVDRSGNESERSAVQSVTPVANVDMKEITDHINAAEVEITNAGKVILESGAQLGAKLAEADKALADTEKKLTGPGGLTERLTGAETLLKDAGSLTYATGQTLRQKLAASDTAISAAQGEITKVANRVSPLEAGVSLLNSTTIPALITSINGKSEIVRSTSAASNQANYRVGDRWEKWSSLATGGKLQQTWRHNGSIWIEEALDASYLPLVDIGAGTFGSLSGGRLEAKSVQADALLIGMGGNLLMDSSFEDEALSKMRAGSNANWSWVKDALGGSHMTATADSGDLSMGNASAAEMFPITSKGAMAFTVEFAGPDLQAYLEVRYADGTSNTGAYLQTLTSATEGTGRRTATVQWDFAGASLSSSGSPPVAARPLLRARPGGTQRVYSVRFAPATKGELIVNGSITGDHVQAESVAGKIGTFIQLNVDQIDVTGSANLKEAVANKFFANIFASNKLTTNELMVGKGENLIPWLVNNPVGSRTTLPHTSLNGGSSLNIDGVGGITGAQAFTDNRTVVPGTYLKVIQLHPGGPTAPALPNEAFEVLPNTTYKLSVWVRAGGTYPGALPRVRLTTGLYNALGGYANGPRVSEAKQITLSWQEIVYEFKTSANHAAVVIQIEMDQPGTLRIDQPSLTRDGASLIATGGIVADHITASEAMSAKIGTFLKLNVGQLTATGTSTLDTAVINNLWTNVVRSRSITTDMLLVGRGSNLIVDPYLLDDAASAYKVGAEGWSRVVLSGSINVMRAGEGSGGVAELSDGWVEVTPGKKYLLTWEQGGVGAANSPNLQATVRYLHADGTASYATWPGSSAATNASGWRTYEETLTIPDGVVSIRPALRKNSGHSGFVYVRAAWLGLMTSSSLIVDGGILAKHLTVTEEMWASIINFKKLRGDQIDANTITADNINVGSLRTAILTANSIKSTMIDADAITAKHTITGATFQTDAGGNTGIKFNRDYLRAWNDRGGETFRITRTTGDVTMTGGTLQTTSASNRGVKFDASGLSAWDSSGGLMFNIDASTGRGRYAGRMSTGPSSEPGVTIVPPSEHASGRSGVWFTPSAGVVGGSETAGVWLDSPASADYRHLMLRGMNGGGVQVNSRLVVSGDTYTGVIRGGTEGRGYVLQQANGSYFAGSLELRGGLNLTADNSTAAPNLIMDGSGKVWRSSSASRFKIDPQPLALPEALLDVPVKDWIDKGQLDYQQELDATARPHTEQVMKARAAIDVSRIPGVLAEEVEAAGGQQFVTYDAAGLVEGVAYDRLALARTAILKQQLDKLAAKLAVLEGAL